MDGQKLTSIILLRLLAGIFLIDSNIFISQYIYIFWLLEYICTLVIDQSPTPTPTPAVVYATLFQLILLLILCVNAGIKEVRIAQSSWLCIALRSCGCIT